MTTVDATPARQALIGILSMTGAIAVFSVMDVIIKDISDTFGTVQIYFFRSALALIPAWFLLRAEGGLAALRTQRLAFHIFRSCISMSFLLCFFYALHLLPLADLYAITFAAPLFITALSVPMLRERVGPHRWAAIGVGFVGVLVILRPGGEVFSLGGLIGLLSSLLFSFSMIFTRQLSRTESNGAIVTYFALTSTVLSGLALPFVWVQPEIGDWSHLTAAVLFGNDWSLLIAIGLIGGVGQILITHAFRSAPVAIVSPFQYTSILGGLVFGYAFFGDLPDAIMLIGAAIVVASGLYILYRETRRGQDPTPQVMKS